MIYDCFTFYNELSLLKVRLHELADVVDRFVLVEATKTFQGKPKPLHYQENKHLFSEYSGKIVHVVVDFPDVIKNTLSQKKNATWGRENYQRDQIRRGLDGAKGSDLVIVSDVDEIIAADALRDAVRRRPANSLTVFEMPMFEGYVNRRRTDRDWLLGPRMIEFSQFKSAQALRSTKALASGRLRGTPLQLVHARCWNIANCGVWNRVFSVENAGWHFTSIGDWQHFRDKIMAYSHAERTSMPAFNDEKAFEERILEKTVPIGIEVLPRYMQSNLQNFPIWTAEAAR